MDTSWFHSMVYGQDSATKVGGEIGLNVIAIYADLNLSGGFVRMTLLHIIYNTL